MWSPPETSSSQADRVSRRPSRTKAGRLVPLPLPCAGPHHPAAIAPTAEIAQPPSLACGPPCSALSAVPWQAQGIVEPPHRALVPATEPPDHAHAWCSTRCRVPPRAESLAHGASPPRSQRSTSHRVTRAWSLPAASPLRPRLCAACLLDGRRG